MPAISLKGVELYNWQIDAVERWLASGTDWDIQGTFSVFTGGGKTVMALACAERVARFEPAVRTVIVVPTVALAIQWKDRILLMTNVGEADIGLRGAGRHDALDGKQVLIAVLNTAAKVLPGMVDSFDRPVMLIVDECHRAGAAKFSNVLGTRARYRLGLSATPERDEVGEDGEPIKYDEQLVGKRLGPVVFQLDLKEARAKGLLPNFHIVHHAVRLTAPEDSDYRNLSQQVDGIADDLEAAGFRAIDAIRTRFLPAQLRPLAERYRQLTQRRKDLLFRSTERRRVLDLLVSERLARAKRILVFHERAELATQLYESFVAEWPDIVAIEHSGLRDSVRRIALERFRTGDVRLLVSVRTLIEGLDVPEVDVGIAAASSSSVRQRVQSLGRVLRRGTPDKVAEMHLLYVQDTVDEVIYEREDWTDLTGEDNNRYFEWPMGGDTPVSRSGPPRRPCRTEEQEWERLAESISDEPVLWEGCVPDQMHSVDTMGNVKNDSGTDIANPQDVLGMLQKVRGPGGAGRFSVTREHRLVVVSRHEGERIVWFVAGRLAEPFRPVADGGPCPEVASIEPGERYSGPSRPAVAFRVGKAGGGVLKRKSGRSTELLVPDAATTEQIRRNRLAILDAWRMLALPGMPISINECGHAYYKAEGQRRFLASAPGGVTEPTQEADGET